MGAKLKDSYGKIIGEIEIRGSRKITKDAHGKILEEYSDEEHYLTQKRDS